ncbi:hypothetical protein KAK06_00815 [Ideonella sp. 4Y11]|uniref:Uncharacterized protein n=1 Tax=Ideonella aquatica TaxID=2824119 RepID=A0A940YFZ7_9BURK|nr:hypothetical protein [Ideonella aquatica]MBQ0957486.1 hypothetical protein [Ideonella aquatica]
MSVQSSALSPVRALVAGLLWVSAGTALGAGLTAPAGAADSVLVLSAAPVEGPDGLRLSLLAVEDHRCPVGIACLWAGYAVLSIGVTQAGMGAEIRLHTPPGLPELPSNAEFQGYRFSLLALEPAHPSASAQILSDYRATVRVQRP